ncbi:MAG: GGDEF and EAL domain-containing protein [Rhodospirillaceae bacterium]|nr:MAG: GGDEF and EAL domain-containing protein [Rhodospirillaceae bacterium]
MGRPQHDLRAVTDGLYGRRPVAPRRGDESLRDDSHRPDGVQSIYRRLVEHSRDSFLVIDGNGLIVFCNPAAKTLFGGTVENLQGRHFGLPFGPDGASTPIELVTPDGQPQFLEMSASAVSWHGDTATLVVLSDVTNRRERETLTEIHTAALETAANGVFITDRAGKIKWVNDALAQMTGYTKDELLEMNADQIKSGDGGAADTGAITAQLNAGKPWRGRVISRRKNGESYTAEETTTPISDSAGRWSYFVSVQEDISERLRTQDQLVRLSKYDSLTGLPNRNQFMDRLQAALVRADRVGAAVAVMVMDLDNFKAINNSLGHAAGDVVIKTVAERVSKLMRTTDTLARLGGGDFGILLENVTDMAAASRTVRRILDCFRLPIKVEGQLLKIGASLGIAAYPKDDTQPAALMRQAELAMYQAKAQGGHAFKYFDRDMDADIRQRVQLESDLRRAIDNGELWLAYQPQLDLVSRRIVGAEALIRWTHPTRGLVGPGDFIPLAESCGLILPIGDWIIREICRQSMEFTRAGLPDLQLGFNVSGVQFRQRDLFQQVMSSLNRTGLPVQALDIEITETVAMERGGLAQENVDRLTAAGISISMDDFGTGYSSLSNLQTFPVRRLKVDASFVRGIGQNRDDEKIVEAVVRLGQSLGLTVVAEGVESSGQMDFLKDRDCDEIQGFLLSKPLPPTDFIRFVENFHH